MSGIAGIIMAAGCAVDEQLLGRMARSLRRRGPDREHTWVSGGVGLAHTWLRTGNACAAQQPASLDGEVWITADARIDGRAELIRALAAEGRANVSATDDAQLILHAYAVWGERCVDHLIGDFAFAIWDGPGQRLFCARDHFGVKPFFYAEADGALIFSNTLDCVLLHPGVDRALDELSIADFLLFGFQHDTSATAFSQVRRLPPAHVLTADSGGARARRYWALPTEGRIRYRRSRDYVDHFAATFREAVGDRLGDDGSSIWLSGGLDSAAIAVTARQVLTTRNASCDLTAHTVVYDTLIPDDERRFAAAAGDAAGIVPRYWSGEAATPFDGWTESGVRTPEPIDDPYFAYLLQQLHGVGERNRIALSGDGGDELLWRSYAVDLIGKMPLRELGSGIARCVFAHRRRPAAGVRAKLAARQGGEPAPALPAWLHPDLVERWRLRERVASGGVSSASTHPLRSEAHRRLSSAAWPAYLERADPGFTGVPLEHRWPFLDVRLVNYALAVPPIPWCVDKQLLRLAMAGSLPPLVLQRRKSPLADDPLRLQLQEGEWSWLERFVASPHLSRFVNRAAVPSFACLAAGENPWSDLRPFCLNYWLSRNTVAA